MEDWENWDLLFGGITSPCRGCMEGVEETVTLEDERWINQILSGLSVDKAYYPALSRNVRLGRYAQGDGSRMYLLYDGTKGRLYVIESFL